jgi:hypothetical protein
MLTIWVFFNFFILIIPIQMLMSHILIIAEVLYKIDKAA